MKRLWNILPNSKDNFFARRITCNFLLLLLAIFTLNACNNGSSGSGSSDSGNRVSEETKQTVKNTTKRIKLRNKAAQDMLNTITASLDTESFVQALQQPDVQNKMADYQLEDTTALQQHSAKTAQNTQKINLAVALAALNELGLLNQVLKPVQTKTLSATSGKQQTPSEVLFTRLGSISNQLEQQSQSLKPNIAPALAANADLTTDEEGNLIEDGDEVIDTTSVEGAAIAIALNAEANGEDPETAINYYNEQLLEHYKENPPVEFSVEIEIEGEPPTADSGDSSADEPASDSTTQPDALSQTAPDFQPQSLYLTCGLHYWFSYRGYSCKHWPGGKVYYIFTDRNNTFKQEVKAAMHDWWIKTNRSVSFTEIPWVFSIFFPHIKISLKHMSRPGEASVGFTWWGKMDIDRDLYTDNNEQNRKKRYQTIRHELGHVLGLLHEHQRWDRHNYLSLTAKEHRDDDYRKIYKTGKRTYYWIAWERKTAWTYWYYYSCKWRGWWRGWSCSWKRKRISTWIWVPYWRKHTVELGGGKGSSWFDCNSIMLYPGIKLKKGKEWCGIRYKDDYGNWERDSNGNYVYRTKANKEISGEDARAVRRIY